MQASSAWNRAHLPGRSRSDMTRRSLSMLFAAIATSSAAAQGPIQFASPQYASYLPRSISRGDIDGDGILDIVTTSWDGSSVVSKGDAQGGFAKLQSYGLIGQQMFAEFGDVTGDGRVDLAVALSKFTR